MGARRGKKPPSVFAGIAGVATCSHVICRWACFAHPQVNRNGRRIARDRGRKNGAPGETRTHAPGFGGRCSIQLSYGGYGRILVQILDLLPPWAVEKGTFVNTCNHRSVYMLEEITKRQLRLGLSTRKLAQQLDPSPTLLSLLLNNKRPTSSDLG